MSVQKDEVGVIELLKCRKISAYQIPLMVKVRVKKGASIMFMKYQELKRRYPQILIGYFQKKMNITDMILPIKEGEPHEETQVRLNTMIQSYEETLQGLNLLENGQLRNSESIEPLNLIKRKKEGQSEDSRSVSKRFRGQKQIIPEQDEQKQIIKKKDDKLTSKQKKKKVNYDEILKKKVGQNYRVFYFPAFLSLSSLKHPKSKQKVEQKESTPVPLKKEPKSLIKKKQVKKPNQPESDQDSLDITFTDSEDEQSNTKNKKRFR